MRLTARRELGADRCAMFVQRRYRSGGKIDVGFLRRWCDELRRTRWGGNTAATQLWVFGQCSQVVERSEGDRRSHQAFTNLFLAISRKHSGDLPVHCVAIRAAGFIVTERFVRAELRTLKYIFAKAQPLAIVLNSDNDFASVAGRVGAVRCDRRMCDANARRWHSGVLLVQ